MKNTKTNVINLLRKMEAEAQDFAKKYGENGNLKKKEYYIGRSLAYNVALNLLKKEEYFNDVNDSYKK